MKRLNSIKVLWHFAFHSGAGSCSSGSIADDSEHTELKACCFPSGCPFGEEALSDENAVSEVRPAYFFVFNTYFSLNKIIP